MTQLTLVLASSSVYRRQLLERLRIKFVTVAANIDETRLANESPEQMVRRLCVEKAKALASSYPNALIIGSDQVCVTASGFIQGKPGNRSNAVKQLQQVSGSEVKLMTGLSLYNSQSGRTQVDVVMHRIGFRQLSLATIERYLDLEEPYECAGSLKSEALGTSLLTYLRGDDPSAVIGLPLIKLTDMLLNEGVSFL